MKREQIFVLIKELALLFLRKVVLVVVILAALVPLSFLVWGPFTWTAFSERLVWIGIICSSVGGFLGVSQTVGGRDYGTPGLFVRTAHANALIDWNIEIRKNIDRRFGFTFQVFFIGVLVFLLGVLVDKLAG